MWTVRIALRSGPDGYATVCIHDEGGNIPPDAMPHLFDRFYRVDRSRSSATGGTGLGLAIAREIARLEMFEQFVRGARSKGFSFVPLSVLLEEYPQSNPAAIVARETPGRQGWGCCQADSSVPSPESRILQISSPE